MHTKTPWSLNALIAAGIMTLGGCADTLSAPAVDPLTDQALVSDKGATRSSNGQSLPRDLQHWLRDLRSETRTFRDFDQAAAHGYVAQLSDCVESPAGGMGYHIGSPGLIDGQLEALSPEILLYEPRRGGGLKFVGVEYIVPFAAWNQEGPPEVQGVALHRNEGLGLWVLHVWTERRNPTGVFEDFNPLVSCDFAPSPEA